MGRSNMGTLSASAEYSRVPDRVGNRRYTPAAPKPLFRVSGLLIISSISIALALATASECHSIFYPPSLLYGLVLWGWWGAIAGVLWKIGPGLPSILRPSSKMIVVQPILGSILGVVHLLLLSGIDYVLRELRGEHAALSLWISLLHINRFGIELLIYGFIFGVIGVVQLQIRAQSEALKSLELQRQLSEAQLRALQMQMEPHFLFNTLNAITTLVELGRQKEAAEMLMHLNTILKSTLKRTTPEKVPLSQELEIVENYLAIEQVRFADRLRVDMKIDSGALACLVPCFLLQPIVENAIRHGIANCENEGVVEASARREGDLLYLQIRDSGSGGNGNHQPGNGIGLRNTKERLEHFYQAGYEMNAQRLDTGGFEVTITIPFESKMI